MSHFKLVPFAILLLAWGLVSMAQAQLTYSKHILNDTLKSDTIFYQGSDTGITTAKVIIKAEAGNGGRGGLDIMMVCDFSLSMKDPSADGAGAKWHLLDTAIVKFINNHLQPTDNIALMRYCNSDGFGGKTLEPNVRALGYQIFPTGKDTAHSIRIYSQDTLGFCPVGLPSPADTIVFLGTGGSITPIDLQVPGTGKLTYYWDTTTATRSNIYDTKFWALQMADPATGAATSYGIKRLIWDYRRVRIYYNSVACATCPQGWRYDTTGMGYGSSTLENIYANSWWNTTNALDSRFGQGVQTATYYGLWKAIDYCMKYRTNTGSQPVIITLTDGTDNRSNFQFYEHTRRQNGTDQFNFPRLPSMLSDTSVIRPEQNSTNFTNMRVQFERYIDSIRTVPTAPVIYVLNLDTSTKPEDLTMYRITEDKNHGTGGWYRKSSGADLDSLYAAIGDQIHQDVATAIPNTPMFIDELNATSVGTLNLVAGSIKPRAANKMVIDSIRTQNVAGKTLIKFYPQGGMSMGDVFEYEYQFTAYLNNPYEQAQAIPVNPDTQYSKASYRSAQGNIEVRYFNWKPTGALAAPGAYYSPDTIFVMSKVTGMAISRNGTSLDTNGTGIRSGGFNWNTNYTDTGVTFYSLIGLKASGPDTVYKAAQSNWSFNPIAWINDGSRTISTTGQTSARPYVIVGNDSSNTQTYALLAQTPHPQRPASLLTAQVTYSSYPLGSADFFDSIAVAYGTPTAAGIDNYRMEQGTFAFLTSGLLYVPLYAIGHYAQAKTWTPVNASWHLDSGFTSIYTNIRAGASGFPALSDTVSSTNIRVQGPGGLVKQSDTGWISISYMNQRGVLKHNTFTLVVLDTTQETNPNAVVILPENLYLPNATNAAVLESLYVYYSTSGTAFSKPAGDTVMTFYALLFNVKPGSVKYKGLDSLANWGVSSTVAGQSFIASGSKLSFTNHFAPRTDIVTVNASIDSALSVTVNWSYGRVRRLQMEASAGSINDNVAGTINPKTLVLLDPTIASDLVYASVRDEYDNFIPYFNRHYFYIPEAGHAAYVTATDSVNPCVVQKVQNGNQSYSLVDSISAGTDIFGVTLSARIADTVPVNLKATGYNGLVIRVASGVTVRDTSGNTYTYSTDLPSNRVVQLRANMPPESLARFVAYSHQIGGSGLFPSGYDRNDNARWYYTNKAPFKSDTAVSTGFTKTVNPSYPVSRDTLVCEWPYGGGFFRDTVVFRVLAGYPTDIVFVFPDTLTAGKPGDFRIVLRDANGDTVTDPSLFPNTIRVYASDTSMAMKTTGGWQSGFDSLYFTDIPVNFVNGVSTDSLLAYLAGQSWVKLQVVLPGIDTFSYQDTFTVEAGAPAHVRIVFQKDSSDCAADTLSSSVLEHDYQNYYLGLVTDAYGNPVTRGAVLTALTWNVSGTLDGARLTKAGNDWSSVKYDASGISVSAQGFATCRVSAGVLDSFRLVVFAPIRVSSVVTHEWVADTLATGAFSVDSVMTNALQLPVAGLTGAQKLSALAGKGYYPHQDGYLDYLDLVFSSPVHVGANALARIWCDHAVYGGNRDTATVWKGRFNHLTGRVADIYALRPADGRANTATDSTHTRYRVWLKPSFLMTDISGKATLPKALETGFAPRIAFNNADIRARNKTGVTLGAADTVITDTSMVADSADPIVSQALFIDNKCSPTGDTRNRLEVYFSEPVKHFSSLGSAFMNFRSLTALTVRNLTDTTARDSVFLADVSIVDSAEEMAGPEQANIYEAEGFVQNRNEMVCFRLTLSSNNASQIKLSSTNNQIKATAFSQPAQHQLFDVPGNTGSARVSRWVSIEPGKSVSTVSCNQTQITSADIHEAAGFLWNANNEPLFPYWGATLLNPYYPNDTTEPKPIRLSVTIFDLLGNLVASAEKNKCLETVLPGSFFLSDSTSGKYEKTKSVDYNLLVQNKAATGGSPCGLLPAWNGVNNKGRLVAPGGYIVKLVISNQVDAPQETTLKLLMTSRKNALQ